MAVSIGTPFKLYTAQWAGNLGTLSIPFPSSANVFLLANTATPLSDIPCDPIGDGTGMPLYQRTCLFYNTGLSEPTRAGAYTISSAPATSYGDLAWAFFLQTTTTIGTSSFRWISTHSRDPIPQPIGVARVIFGLNRAQNLAAPNAAYYWGIGDHENGINFAGQGLNGDTPGAVVRANLEYLGGGTRRIWTTPNSAFNISDVTGSGTIPPGLATTQEQRVPFRISTLGHPASFWAGFDLGRFGATGRSETFFPVHNMVLAPTTTANIRTLHLPVMAGPFANGDVRNVIYRVRAPLPTASLQCDYNPWDVDAPSFSVRNRHVINSGSTATTFYPILALRKTTSSPLTQTNAVRIESCGVLSGGTALRYTMGVRTVLSLGGNVGAWTPVANSVCEYNDLIGSDTTVASRIIHGSRAVTEDVESTGASCWRFPMGDMPLQIDVGTPGFANASIAVLGVYPTAGIADSFQAYVNFREAYSS